MNINSFPLSWPIGWARIKSHQISRSRFKSPSMDAACREVIKQLRMMHIPDWKVIISTNVKTRQDGMPYSNLRQPDDKGVAVYFKRGNKDHVFAADQYDRVEDNLWAIAKSLDAMRAIERYGVTQVMDRVFSGFAALPEKATSRTWYQVLGVVEHAPTLEIIEKYRSLAKLFHPDANGGASEGFLELQEAYDQFKKIRGL
jgi:hypothetical protein